MIEFRIDAVPVAQPRPRAVMVGSGPKAHAGVISAPSKHAIHVFKASCRFCAAQAYKGPPLDRPLFVSIEFVMPRPNNLIWKTREMPSVPHAKKPDLENCVKGVLDALTGILWRDDSLVAELHARKRIAAGNERAHVIVSVRITS